MIKIDKYEIDPDCFYDPAEHFWIRLSGNTARLGLSPLIQESNGAFVAVDMHGTGKNFMKGEAFGTIEAEKHVGPLKIPLSGKVIRINEKVLDNPRLINTDPYGDGWLIEMEMSKPGDEVPELIYGTENVKEWFESELKKFDDKGWIAQQ